MTEFLDEAGEFLLSERARNTIMLTVAEAVRAGEYAAGGTDDAPVFGWCQQASQPVTAACLQTPPFPLLLSAMPERAAVALAEVLAARGRRFPGVNATEEVAAAFAAAWREHRGTGSRVFRRMRLFRLGSLAWPDPVPAGAARIAAGPDRALVADWFAAFARDAGEMTGQDHGRAAEDRLSYHGITFWEAGGQPAALAGVTRMVAGMVRVGPVYTPPELRGRGYAGAVTATVSQTAIDAGAAEVLLYTDLANPTSNALYTRLGYRPVEDRVMLAFGE